MTCSACGSVLDEGVLYCRECRTLLIDDATDAPPPDEDERVLLLAQGCELVQSGEWDLGTFREWLAEFTTEQERRESQVQGVYQSVPIGLEEDFQEEMETGFHGVTSVKEALALLADYDPEASSPSILTRSLALFFQGVCTVKEAMQINRRNRGRPLWI